MSGLTFRMPSEEPEDSSLVQTLHSAAIGVIATDIDGNVEFLNAYAERLLGVSASYAVGQPLEDVLPLFERLGGKLRGDLVELALVSGSTVTFGPDVVLMPKGTGVPVEIEGEISVRLHAGSLTGTVTTFRDVTARNRKVLQEAEEAKARTIGQLAGSVAHTLNNLLTVILGHSEALREEYPSALSICEATGEISRAGEEISNIARQLLTLSGRERIEPKIVDANSLVRTIAPRIAAEFPRVNFRTFLAPDLGAVLADGSQLEQALRIIVRFVAARVVGGSTVRVRTQNAIFDENCRGRYLKRFVQISIGHSGPRLPQAIIDQVVNPVWETSSPGSLYPEALALQTMLAVARGHLTAETGADGGTEFVLALPLHDEEHAALLRSAVEAKQSAATVMLVEDDHAIRVLLRNGLEQHGYQVIEAIDGPDAVQQAEWCDQSLDLLIADVLMPGMSGPAAARAVARVHPGIKVLLISGASHDSPIPTGFHFLRKPFSRSELLDRVRMILESAPDNVDPVAGPAASGWRSPTDQ